MTKFGRWIDCFRQKHDFWLIFGPQVGPPGAPGRPREHQKAPQDPPRRPILGAARKRIILLEATQRLRAPQDSI